MQPSKRALVDSTPPGDGQEDKVRWVARPAPAGPQGAGAEGVLSFQPLHGPPQGRPADLPAVPREQGESLGLSAGYAIPSGGAAPWYPPGQAVGYQDSYRPRLPGADAFGAPLQEYSGVRPADWAAAGIGIQDTQYMGGRPLGPLGVLGSLELPPTQGAPRAPEGRVSDSQRLRAAGDAYLPAKPQLPIRKAKKTDDFSTRVPKRSRSTTEGLEAQTRRVLEVLQLHGRLTFDEILSLTGIDHRRLYDILNTLATTPFVTKIGKKRENTPYVWADGRPLPEPVRLDSLLFLIEAEQQACLELLAELYGR